MKKKTIYFHIGTTKTGSTSIQSFLRENRSVLERSSVDLYTGDEKDPADQLRVQKPFCGGVDASFCSSGGDVWIKEFLKRVEARPESTVILTEELVWFCLWHPHRQRGFCSLIAGLRKFADVRIIVYLRRQDNFFMSSYQECLKYGWPHGRTCSQELRKKKQGLQYRERLEWLTSIVGRENMIVRPFETGQFSGESLITDFMNTVELEMTREYVLTDHKHNVGLSPFVAELLRCLSFYKQEASCYDELVRFAVGQGCVYLNSEPGFAYLSPADRRQLIAEFEETNRWVATELLGRRDGILFYDPLPDMDEPWGRYQLNPDDVREFFSRADLLDSARRTKMCRQVLSVCGDRKPLWLRVRDRSKVELRRFLRKRGLRKWARRIH